ncbi:hypothetical protein MPH_03622 [Macrophomina phaseolina MS6]|uniref:Uncharacterized protein n=1 Tax=Macrophomina phaseolina (strain MS6) TaxID=1126212 RepID=K2R9E7_MACPH|nr:hypothetical protein MPH_03622 [Macrophomina phaseolina MS6]
MKVEPSETSGKWAEKADGPQFDISCRTRSLVSFSRLSPTPILTERHMNRWEVQRFVHSVIKARHNPSDYLSHFCAIDKKLDDLRDRMADQVRDDLDSAGTVNFTSRTVSLNCLYHLCITYLNSSLVPVLSCSARTPDISQKMLRSAAEQAWEHSGVITRAVECCVMRKATISKLWPIVGYSAYVGATIQLRFFLALGVLNGEHLERTKVHLRLLK